ncbi:hypothetical protein J6590_001837 [Homalodisca vitripennis]|nr:hypothetical protein J6590_001837 [Homalodisca vitripennis]
MTITNPYRNTLGVRVKIRLENVPMRSWEETGSIEPITPPRRINDIAPINRRPHSCSTPRVASSPFQ